MQSDGQALVPGESKQLIDDGDCGPPIWAVCGFKIGQYSQRLSKTGWQFITQECFDFRITDSELKYKQ